MTDKDSHLRHALHRHPAHPHAHQHASPHAHAAHRHQSHPHAAHGEKHPNSGRQQWGMLRRGAVRILRRPFVRRTIWTLGTSSAVAAVGCGLLWWRLASGPIELDLATPWLKAAIQENFGSKHTVTVGGTQLERDENGRTSLRIRDIVVRDADGTVVASAPKAEVGIDGRGLLTGKVRAQSLNLVGAEMAVRIEADGNVTIFAGANKRPIAVAVPTKPMVLPELPAKPGGGSPAVNAPRGGVEDLAGLLGWLDGLGASGLDGHDLREIGLKNGNLSVDDQRNGKHWAFQNINLTLTRPDLGGVLFRVASENPKRPWQLSAAMRQLGDGVRAIGIEARKVSLGDLLLAMRLNETGFETDLPLSASVRAEIGRDGTPQAVQGEVFSEAGNIVSLGQDPSTLKIDRADFRFTWDVHRHMLVVPFQLQAGGNQITMRATLETVAGKPGLWSLAVTREDQVIDPIILSASGAADDEGFSINRAIMRARIDTTRKRIDLEQGDFSRIDTRPSHNVAIALSGSLDFSGADPQLAFGVAGTRMPGALVKRLWPIFAATPVRDWVQEHMSGGTVERIVIAGNASIPAFRAGGPPMPAEGLSIDIETSGTTIQPVATLPAIRDADLTVHVTGANATINLGRGTVEVSPGRKLNIASGVFEVPDTHLKPSPAKVQFRVDGTMPAVAALLASDAFRDNAGVTLDPDSSRGSVAAQVALNLTLNKTLDQQSADYSISADLTNFAADKGLMGRKLEASALHVTANAQGYQIKGDARINGTPAALEFRKVTGEPDGDLRLRTNVDETARNRLGIDFGNTVSGSIPVKITGRVGGNAGDDRMFVDADLTPVKIENLLPGWVKPAGKAARATYTFYKDGKGQHFDDLTIEGPGTTVRGSVELTPAGELASANFPVFSLSDGDKVTLKADRGADNVLRVLMRGDVYDGRNFVKTSLANQASEKTKQKDTDLDLDIKIGAVAGHNGEALRGLELRLSRRGGKIRNFVMNSKIGRDTPLTGDLRLRARDNHQVVYFETDDAGALFRFTDMYPHIFGGQIWVAMDPPTQDQAPQVGVVNLHNFVVRGEPGLDRVLSGAPGGNTKSGVEFTEMHADFTRFPGRMSVRDGVVRGPVVGATVEGQIDYKKNEVHLRGTFVPFYGLNNMFGQIPIVGFFLGGGSNEGLLGITYEAVGPPGAPRILVNPVSAIAPGLLRKFIPSPGSFDPNFVPPSR